MQRLLATAAAAAVAAAVFAFVAVAPSGAAKAAKPKAPSAMTVVKDCTRSATGALQRRYSARVLKNALRKVNGDLAEYSDCAGAIRAQLRKAKATINAGIRGRRGTLALLDTRGRTVDVLSVKRGQRVTFKVVKGRYTLRANGRRACSKNVTAKARKTVRATVVCR